MKEYDFGIGHPLRGDRYNSFISLLHNRIVEGEYYRFITAEPATEADLLQICSREYIDFNTAYFKAANFRQNFDDRFYQYHSADNLPNAGFGRLEEAARLIVGQAKLAADLVMTGEYSKAVCIGGGSHHARKDYGEGFCIYNDVAFAAKHLTGRYRQDRVLILDTDAHAGNGTAKYFFDNPKVLFIDMHQNPATLYPGTGFAGDIGSGEGKGYTINIPLPVQAGYESYQKVFEEIIEPVVAEFQPQVIIRNGGSDPHFADGLTGLGLTVTGFKMIGEKVKRLSNICGGKEIDLIASGYNAKVLPYAWLALISGLADFPLEAEEIIPVTAQFPKDISTSMTGKVIADVRKYLKDYWKCFK